MRVNADSSLIRAAATSTSGTLNDLTTDLIMANNNIEYKLLLYTYKALHGLALGYLCELVVPSAPRRVLRSAESSFLTVPPGKPGKYGSRSFVRASPNLWDSLKGGGERAVWLKNSLTVESFKRNLKTYLFCELFLS